MAHRLRITDIFILRVAARSVGLGEWMFQRLISGFVQKAYRCIFLSLVFFMRCLADENPFLSSGTAKADMNLSAFTQNDTGDCFFLASLIAIAQDADGRQLIESALHGQDATAQWVVIFPNIPTRTIKIKQQELLTYRLTNSVGDGESLPVRGNLAVRLLEIAADKYWKQAIKREGLWDDVPMNALFMFSNAEQMLIWNRGQATRTTLQDIEKYRGFSLNSVTELPLNTTKEIENSLKNILKSDIDGISLVLIDYIHYHAVAINAIDFINRSYKFIDTYSDNNYSNKQSSGNFDALLQGIVQGDYALDYLEINP